MITNQLPRHLNSFMSNIVIWTFCYPAMVFFPSYMESIKVQRELMGKTFIIFTFTFSIKLFQTYTQVYW